MEEPHLEAAILIVSDTASQDPSTDKAQTVLVDTFRQADRWQVTETKIVGDDVLAIQRALTGWCDRSDAPNLVVTTGGTGFAIKDHTPEAVNPLLERHATGLVHGMLAASLQVTPFALMSRPVAGVRKKTLIITLPGSPKGAKENLLSVIKLLPHACSQAAGEDSRAAHAGGIRKLEQKAGVSSTGDIPLQYRHNHRHEHHHAGHHMPKAHVRPEDRPSPNDPSKGPAARHRDSPYPMLPVESAVRLILEHSPRPEAVRLPVDVALVGYTLAEDVHATEAVPAYRASIVDGYAVIVSSEGPSTKGVFPVVSISHATSAEIPTLHKGQVARITTGAPLPPGANSVVMVEDTVIESATDDGSEEMLIRILTDEVQPDENVREVGSDIRTGDVVLNRGEEITAVGGELALLASVGKAEVSVYKKPTIGVLSTGDEIVQHDRLGALNIGEVRDCNRPTLVAAISGWGYKVVDLGIARDRSSSLEEHLRSGLRTVDIIITSGGVSMGELDLLKPTLERSMGGTIHFGRVNMKPGKPSTFATVPYKSTSGDQVTKLVFSMPGNPASAFVTAHLFVLPSLSYTSGRDPPYGLPRLKVVLDEGVRCDAKRPEYQRVAVRAEDDGRIWASSTGGQRSSKMASLRGAGGFLCLPAQDAPIGRGKLVDALFLGNLAGLSP